MTATAGGRRAADAVRLAVGTLTAVPVRPPADVAGHVPGTAMVLAPLAGVLVGAAGGVVAAAAVALDVGPAAGAGLVLGAGALGTRAFHLDGLADTADGLAASFDRTRALEVMRRGDIGPAGVVAVVVVLLVQAGALTRLLSGSGPGTAAAAATAVLVCVAVSRLAVPLACLRGVPAARADGLGALVAGSVSPLALSACTLLSAGGAGALLAAAGAPWWGGPLTVGAALAAAALVIRHARRRLGGVTGDIIGAAVEVAAAAALLALAPLAPF